MDTINLIVSKNIKQARQEKGLSLEELARLSGVSKSMLAQIERGSGNPSLTTLWKIADGMKVPFSRLVTRPQAPYDVVRISELDPILGDGGKRKNYALFPDGGNQRFSVYYIEVEPGYGWAAEPHVRETVEFITVFSGELELRIGENAFRLKRGESIRFKADLPHSYRNAGGEALVFHNILYNP